MNITVEDSKLLKQIIQILEKSCFKDISAPQCLTIAIAFERFGAFKKRVDDELQAQAKFSAVVPTAPKATEIIEEPKSKKKK